MRVIDAAVPRARLMFTTVERVYDVIHRVYARDAALPRHRRGRAFGVCCAMPRA